MSMGVKICWSPKVSKGALTTLYERKWNKPSMLPVSNDVAKVHNYVSDTINQKIEALQTTTQKSDYSQLAKAILVQLILFNRRRSGEVERMEIEQFHKASSDVNDDVMQGLSQWERKLCTKLSRVEIRGKRGRKVPILLSASMVQSIKLLISKRDAVGVLPSNPYLFARPGCSTSYRGCDSIKTFVKESGAEHPEYVTSTRLRKHVATLSQLLCLKDNELDVLATFMGHDIRVHREYYRLPENTLQTAKVAKILMLLEKGQVDNFAGKNLEDININLEGKYF